MPPTYQAHPEPVPPLATVLFAWFTASALVSPLIGMALASNGAKVAAFSVARPVDGRD